MKYILKKIFTGIAVSMAAGGCLYGFMNLMNLGVEEFNRIDDEERKEKIEKNLRKNLEHMKHVSCENREEK